MQVQCGWLRSGTQLRSAEDLRGQLRAECDLTGVFAHCPWLTPGRRATWGDVARVYGGALPCATTGLAWECQEEEGERDAVGDELVHAALSERLRKGERRFTEAEWARFGVDATMDSYVRAGETLRCRPYAHRVCRPPADVLSTSAGVCVDAPRPPSAAATHRGEDVRSAFETIARLAQE